MVVDDQPLPIDFSPDERVIPTDRLVPFETPTAEREGGFGGEGEDFDFAEGELAHGLLVWVGLTIVIEGGLPAASRLSPRAESQEVILPIGGHKLSEIPFVPVLGLVFKDAGEMSGQCRIGG